MTDETHNTNPKTTRPRRWFRFRLRTLLVMVTLLTVPLGWIGWELDQRRREKATIAWVEKLGGHVDFDPLNYEAEISWWDKTTEKLFGDRVVTVWLNGTEVSDLSPLAELKNLERLELVDTKVSDLSPLADLKKLEILLISDTPVNDLSPLTELKILETVWLYNTQVTDLSPLTKLKNLHELHFDNSQVNDLSPLGELIALEYLVLDNTQVNDLSPLAELKNLERLELSNTQGSDLSPLAELKNLKFLDLPGGGYLQKQDLRRALPKCQIQQP